MNNKSGGGNVILFSFLAALMLSIVPMPAGIVIFRPEWVALTLIYWCIALPQRVGLGWAWCIGLLLDVARDALLGQHALGLTLTAFLCLKLHQRIRVYPIWQQSFSVFVLIIVYLIPMLWINGIMGKPATWAFWAPAVSSIFMWPVIYVVLRSVRQGFKVT